MIAGARELNEEYYKLNPIPLGKDASASFFYISNLWKILKNTTIFLINLNF